MSEATGSEPSANEPSGTAERPVVVLTCMDNRLDPLAVLGLGPGGAYVVRNAGGYVTEDAIRSICLAQQLAGVTRVVVVHHTDCKASEKTAEEYRALVESGTGVSPGWDVAPVADPHQRVRAAMAQLRASPLVDAAALEGYVYDIEAGRLEAPG